MFLLSTFILNKGRRKLSWMLFLFANTLQERQILLINTIAILHEAPNLQAAQTKPFCSLAASRSSCLSRFLLLASGGGAAAICTSPLASHLPRIQHCQVFLYVANKDEG